MNDGKGTGRNFRSLRRISAWGLAAFLATGEPAPAQAARGGGQELDPLIERTRARYDVARWPQGVRRAGFDLGAVELTGLVGGKVEHDAGGVTRKFVDASGVARVLVELQVGEQAADAHAALLRHVAYVQSTKFLPTAAERGIRAGDLGYIGYGGRDGSKIAWLAFVVGNLEFRVKNLDPDAAGAVDVTPHVEAIADRAMAQEALPDGAPLPKPAIARFATEAPGVKAGESLLLDVVARDVDGRPAALDFVVGGWQQGQGYVELDEQGRWRFHATGRGATELTVRALGRNGTTTTQTLKLTID